MADQARADRALGVIAALPPAPGFAVRAAVLANLVAVVSHGEAEDYECAAALGRQLGDQQVAALRNELDALVGTGPGLPFVTRAIVRLSRGKRIEGTLVTAGRSASVARRVAMECVDGAFWLLVEGVRPDRCAPMPATPDELRQVVRTRGADTWREVLGNVAAMPWGPDAERLTNVAREADIPGTVQVIERCVELWQSRAAQRERLDVAKEIRRLVAVSGCTQRQFAASVGTSASRLSTYVNATVTPSATMMNRITWSSSRLAPKTARRAATSSAGVRRAAVRRRPST